jgi:TrmH family RNA methyltransferase
MNADLHIASTQNPRIKSVLKLNKRTARDEQGLLLVEGYRELKRALDNGWKPRELFFCRDLFLGSNEDELIRRSAEAGASLLECSEPVLRKISYRDRPEGLVAVGPQVRYALSDLTFRETPFLVVAEAIEKPGNLGTILRSADAAGADGLIVCDRCTDISNPNVVRASIGTLFTVKVIEASTDEALPWLRRQGIRVVSATPHAECLYTDVDMTGPVAVVVGSEQYGLSTRWMNEADIKVRIPMFGQADSLNVASATTLLLYEVVRQRGLHRSKVQTT